MVLLNYALERLRFGACIITASLVFSNLVACFSPQDSQLVKRCLPVPEHSRRNFLNSGRQPQQLLVIAAHSLPTGGGTPDEDRAPGEEEYEGEELEQGEGETTTYKNWMKTSKMWTQMTTTVSELPPAALWLSSTEFRRMHTPAVCRCVCT